MNAARLVFAARGPDDPTLDDFVEAAGISRAAFYKHFRSVGELLRAVSERTTREALERIETEIITIDDPAVRLGVGVRLFLNRASGDRGWCRFVARVWQFGGLERAMWNLDAGRERGAFHAPSPEAARDLVLGGLRETLRRIGDGEVDRDYPDEMIAMYLQVLGLDAGRIAEVMNRVLPVPSDSSWLAGDGETDPT